MEGLASSSQTSKSFHNFMFTFSSTLTPCSTRKGEIAYGVVAGFVWIVYLISIFVGESKRRRDRKAAVRAEAEPKRNESDSSDSRIRTNYYA